MRITRRFTSPSSDPFACSAWVTRSSRITNPDGSVVFEMKDAEVPEGWSQLATDIMVSKYFRKAGVPQMEEPYAVLPRGWAAEAKHGKGHIPSAVKRHKDGAVVTGPERSARQVIHRLAGCWRHWGETHGYFDTKDDAQAFYDEIVYMMVHQVCAPNSPQWFNTGLNWAYGLTGPAQGHWIADAKSGETKLAEDAYTHPQPHACFIQSIDDDLVNPGGIMDLWVREARLFKYGSGTGTNFSRLRGEGEKLSGGGRSSGLMSWLRIGDRAAGAIKSGGTTRRAAKMVCLDLDHPDIEAFINWKVREEIKVAALVEGMKHLGKDQKETAEKLGLKLDYDFNGEAYYTVSGQNSNNSVRIPDQFFDALDNDADWRTTWRNGGETARTYRARDLWEQISFAAWRCADPGVQYDGTINAWHTCPNSGRINASNPCSEYMFLDNTACNLASINLLKFYDSTTRAFDVERYEHAIDLWTMVLEISVLMAAFPSREIARLSYDFRTLGLGFANIGAMLMQAGVAYDSPEARTLCGMISSIMTGRSYRMSALMSGEHGPFAGYAKNREAMLRVIRNHRRAAHGTARNDLSWEALHIRPVPIDHALADSPAMKVANARAMLARATVAWDEALELGQKHGYRNAQVTVIAPTGTIGLLMDCDTTGVEPDFALVKFKKLAGGGYFKIVNDSVRPALEALGYAPQEVNDILTFVLGTLHLDVPMPSADGRYNLTFTFAEFLRRAGFSDAHLRAIVEGLPGVFEIQHAFSAWSLPEDLLKRVGVDPAKARSESNFNLLRTLGLTQAQVRALNEVICGTQTVEGAPHLKGEHLPVFDCANPCGQKGVRFIAPEGHIRMMAASQPFISGAISKTINLPANASVDDIKSAYRLSWELGLKANALYRDGCKLSQPLSTKSDDGAAGGSGSSEATADAGGAGSGGAESVGGAAQPVDAAVRMLMNDEEDHDDADAAREEVVEEFGRVVVGASGGSSSDVRTATDAIQHRPMRRRLADTRRSITHKFNIAGHEGYLTVGLYDDGQPGELFITMAKEGSTIGGLMDSLGTATSVALQYGVPIESLVNKFTHQRFEPAGMTANPDIPFAKSLVDYIFRWLGMQFITGYKAANAPRRSYDDAPSPAGRAEGGPTPAQRFLDSMSSPMVEPRLASTGAGSARGAVVVATTIATSVSSERSEVQVHPGAGPGAHAVVTQTARADSLSIAMLDCQGDAPACEVCGTITVRNGTCYKCLNCGHSMGCS